jgi:hypothetical protein
MFFNILLTKISQSKLLPCLKGLSISIHTFLIYNFLTAYKMKGAAVRMMMMMPFAYPSES